MARRSEVVLGPVALTLGSNHVDGWWSRLSAPVAILLIASEVPGTWAYRSHDMCSSLDAPLPSVSGVFPGAPQHHARRWFDSHILLPLESALRSRVLASASALATIHLPLAAISMRASGALLDGAMIHFLVVGQPATVDFQRFAVFVQLLLVISFTVCQSAPCSRTCVRSGASDAPFLHSLVPSGPVTRGSSTVVVRRTRQDSSARTSGSWVKQRNVSCLSQAHSDVSLFHFCGPLWRHSCSALPP